MNTECIMTENKYIISADTKILQQIKTQAFSYLKVCKTTAKCPQTLFHLVLFNIKCLKGTDKNEQYLAK